MTDRCGGCRRVLAVCRRNGVRTRSRRRVPGTLKLSPNAECCRDNTTGKAQKTRRLFCPTSQDRRAKIFIFPKGRNYDLTKLARPNTRDVRPSSRHVGRVAMDATAREMMRAKAYGQAVWFWLPDAGVNPRVKSPGGWWLKSPAHQEEHGAAVKPLRRECRVISAYLCWPACVSFVCTQGSGCGVHPAFPAPSAFEGATLMQQLGRNRAAGMRTRVSCCRPGQASACERDPGSITAELRVTDIVSRLYFAERFRGMGPRFRGDDLSIKSAFPYTASTRSGRRRPETPGR
jgi:hypothetical protein